MGLQLSPNDYPSAACTRAYPLEWFPAQGRCRPSFIVALSRAQRPAATALSEVLRHGRYTEGLVRAVAYAGDILARRFPRDPGRPEGAGLPDELTGD
jgi:hypothetical protein